MVSIAIATILAVFLFAVIYLSNVCKLAAVDGAHTYYLDAPSSQALQKKSLSILDTWRVRGESVRIENADVSVVDTLLEELHANVLWVEEVDGVTSYYCYTPLWRGGVMIGKRTVNLHIAYSNNCCVLGSPIIFGGF